jgi:hypothetical protein
MGINALSEIRSCVSPQGTRIYFSKGKFDNWCVYLKKNGTAQAPHDKTYFQALKELSDKYGADVIYNKFVEIYDRTSNKCYANVVQYIEDLSADLDKEDRESFWDTLTTIYFAMVAEENKKFTKLGKRIKRLGVHQILQEDLDISKAAHYSMGMKWRQIHDECTERGF